MSEARLDLFEELLKLTAALGQAEIPYALSGGLAVAIHGAPRATADIDLLLRPEDVTRTMEVVRPLGFVFEAAPMRFPDGMEIRRVSKIQQGELLTLDLLLINANLEEAWSSRQSVVSRSATLWVISRDALIRMKLAAGRTRDLADVERLRDLDR